MRKKFKISELELPLKKDLNSDLLWLASSFGYCDRKGKMNDEANIFCEMIIDISKKGKTSTKIISKKLNMPLQKVIYHVRTFIDDGFFYRKKRFIYLRENSIYETIIAVRKDVNRIFDNLERIGMEIDEALKFKNRSK